jgi:FkbM family methyltransferase
MATIKRSIANALGWALNASIVRRGTLATMFEKEHLKRFVTELKVDCVFDVGANDGQYAEMLREIGFLGPIISFEPIPELAKQIRERAQRDVNWYAEEIALDDSEHTASFNVMQSSQFSSLKTPSHAETTRFEKENSIAYALEIKTALLSSYFDRYQAQLGFQRPFLKMDTQGNDLAVARGAGSRLSSFVGLQSELAIKRIYASADDYRTALDFYHDAGFELSAFVPNNLGHFPVLIEIDCIMFNSKLVS